MKEYSKYLIVYLYVNSVAKRLRDDSEDLKKQFLMEKIDLFEKFAFGRYKSHDALNIKELFVFTRYMP